LPAGPFAGSYSTTNSVSLEQPSSEERSTPPPRPASGAPRSSARLYATNAVSSVATRVLQLTVLVWVNQHLLRRIAPEEYSLLPLVMSLIVFADILKNVFTGGIVRFLVEADARNDDLEVTRIVTSMVPVLAGAALLCAAAGGAAAWWIDAILKIEPEYVPEARLMLFLLVGMLCLTILATPLAYGLYIRQKFPILNLIELGCETLRVVILLVLLLGVSTRVIWLVVATTCAGLASLAIRIALTRRLMPSIRLQSGAFSVPTIKRLTGYGAWTTLQGFTRLVSDAVPPLILNRFGTALDVAAFHLGRLPDVQMRRIVTAAALPAQPALTSIYATRGEEALRELYYHGGRYHLWLTLAIIAPLVVFAPEIVALYVGEKYAISATVASVLLGIYPFVWSSAMFYRIAHAVARIAAFNLCDAVVQGAIVLALFYAVAVQGWGAVGAGLAIAAVNVVLHLALMWPMGLRLVKGSWKQFARKTIVPGILPFAAALLACFGFRGSLSLDSWTKIGLGSLLALVVYLVVLLAFCLDAMDRDLIRRLRRRTGAALERLFPRLAPELQAGRAERGRRSPTAFFSRFFLGVAPAPADGASPPIRDEAAPGNLRACFVPFDRNNPYQRQLVDHLQRLGVQVSTRSTLKGLLWSVLTGKEKPAVVHLHWLPSVRPTLTGVLRVLAFAFRLGGLRLLGKRIVWTAHNLYSHEATSRRLEWWLTRIVLGAASGVIVHSETARRLVAEEFRLRDQRKILVVPHGNYIGSYPNAIPRDEARRRLGLPAGNLVFLFLGNLRPYKGVDRLIEAFRELKVEEASLVIAGRALNEAMASQLEAAVAGDERVQLGLGFVADDMVQVYMNGCDVVVLPYRDILTSGAVILAMSFGRACIAPGIGCIRDVLDERGAFLYDPSESDGLLKALERAVDGRERLREMGAHNLAEAEKWGWEGIARQTASLYDAACGRREAALAARGVVGSAPSSESSENTPI
jgi:glycosyltransferase involved in cell wall biosynthesis/O-antigen/teichoic acid export membrane protein